MYVLYSVIDSHLVIGISRLKGHSVQRNIFLYLNNLVNFKKLKFKLEEILAEVIFGQNLK